MMRHNYVISTANLALKTSVTCQSILIPYPAMDRESRNLRNNDYENASQLTYQLDRYNVQ